MYSILKLLKKSDFILNIVRTYRFKRFLKNFIVLKLFDQEKIFKKKNLLFLFKSKKVNKFLSNSKHKKNLSKKYEISFQFKQLKNIDVYYGFFVTNSNYIFYTDCDIDIYKEILPEEHRGLFSLRSYDKVAVKKINNHKIIDRCIVCTNPLHDNYAHFVLQTLPAIVWFSKQKKYLNYTFVFNQFSHKNFYEIINILNIKKTFFLKDDKKIFAKTGIIFSPVCKIIYATRLLCNEKNFRHFGKFNHNMLDYMSEIISKKFPKTDNKCHNIYYKRSNTYRLINNSYDYEEYLKNKNFKIISGYLSLNEQINYLRTAKNIIVCNGSEIANLVFANKKANIYLISSYNDYSMPSFWVNFLAKRFKKLKVFYIKLDTDDIHASFNIDLKKFDKFFRSH